VDGLGAPQRTDWLRRRMYQAMAAAGVRKVRPYDARHSVLTYLATNGVPDVIVSAWAGHADLSPRSTQVVFPVFDLRCDPASYGAVGARLSSALSSSLSSSLSSALTAGNSPCPTDPAALKTASDRPAGGVAAFCCRVPDQGRPRPCPRRAASRLPGTARLGCCAAQGDG
jgi:hypothetical protein